MELEKVFDLELLKTELQSASEEVKPAIEARIKEVEDLYEKELTVFEKCKSNPTQKNVAKFVAKYQEYGVFNSHIDELNSLLGTNQGEQTPDEQTPDEQTPDEQTPDSTDLSPLQVINQRKKKYTESPIELAIALRKGKKLTSKVSVLTAIKLRKLGK